MTPPLWVPPAKRLLHQDHRINNRVVSARQVRRYTGGMSIFQPDPVGQPVMMPRHERRDARTGRTVWQITSGPGESVAPYMEAAKWSPDERFLFFMANRTGAWQPYRLELATGQLVRLAQVDGALYRSLAYEPNRNEVYVEQRGTFLAIDAASLAVRLAADFRPWLGDGVSGKGRAATLSGDGSRCAISCRDHDGWPIVVIMETNGSNRHQVIRLQRNDFAVGHLQFNPTDNHYLSACSDRDRQNHPDEKPFLRAREYHLDTRTGSIEPLVLMPPGFRATHCVWGASGKRLYFHRKTVPTWTPTALCSVDTAGQDLRVHYETNVYKLGHCHPDPQENWLVADSQDPDENILMLAHLHRERHTMVCWPNMSINSNRPDERSPDLPAHNDRHTHPAFSPRGNYIVYTSDITGRSQVYVAPVADLVGTL